MLSRRSLFSLFAGTAAIAAGAKVAKASPADTNDQIREMLADRARATRPEREYFTIMDTGELPEMPNCRCVIEPVNMRSDGSIRHRQHHPVDFPPKR